MFQTETEEWVANHNMLKQKIEQKQLISVHLQAWKINHTLVIISNFF